MISNAGDAAVASTAVRGAFVVLEGLDRSGKTTQVKLLQSRLIEAGRRVQLMRFPGEFAQASSSWWGLGYDRPSGRWLAWKVTWGFMADGRNGPLPKEPKIHGPTGVER